SWEQLRCWRAPNHIAQASIDVRDRAADSFPSGLTVAQPVSLSGAPRRPSGWLRRDRTHSSPVVEDRGLTDALACNRKASPG
ncbi:MAG: hypothetical protein WBD41_21685, partial [Rhodococcus sp. (in: high G+C Gram-positive bacteria)]